MSYENYDDVRSQLMSAGLVLEGELRVGGTKSARCRVEGRGREKRGWYWLREALIDGRYYLIGAYGVYEGTDPGTQKIKLTKRCESCHREVAAKERKCPHCQGKVAHRELSEEQKAAHRARILEDERIEKARRQAEADKAARRAELAWQRGSTSGTCEYLTRKHVASSYGARFTSRGNLMIPMLDTIGRIHGLQVIYGDPEIKRKKERDKDFWPAGVALAGHFYLVGEPGPVILLCEGFATMASILEATRTLPVAMAFVANNLGAVARALHKKYPRSRILVCADDDYATRNNPGMEAAQLAALEVGGAWVKPEFALDTARADIAAQVDMEASDYKAQVGRVLAGRPKLSDFNDLHVTEGLHLVAAQIDAKLQELGWRTTAPARAANDGGEGGRALAPITSTDEIFNRFAIIYGHNKALFDFQERMLLSLDDMKNACSGREIWRNWMESPNKRIVRIRNVGFDPSGENPDILCNLWGGFAMTPREGACDKLLELLQYICSYEKNHKDIYEWILNWLAYPLQHPGAKMKTAIVIHGPQRVGKNFFFESAMEIYGEYGGVIDQDALEDKFNDCFSKKLYLIADEVIARQELYHVKNKLKGMITGKRIRINPKNVASYWEDNHCNLIFLSNETMPLVLERDDGRHVVLWTPPKLSREFYLDVKAEVESGGVEALYHFLLQRDLGNFGPHTEPPMTDAKIDLMDLSMDSTERFWIEWSKDRIQPVTCRPVKSTQLYAFYREWCSRCGYPRYAPEPRFLAEIHKRTGAKRLVGRYISGANTKQAAFIMPLGYEQPLDKNQMAWLGECVEAFTEEVTAWREENHAMRP